MDDYMKMIVFELRLPRIIMAFLVGMLLASSGNIVQIIFQNPLADPYIIGIASSATFGAVIAYLLKLPEFYYGVIAFISCMLSTLLIFKISNQGASHGLFQTHISRAVLRGAVLRRTLRRKSK